MVINAVKMTKQMRKTLMENCDFWHSSNVLIKAFKHLEKVFWGNSLEKWKKKKNTQIQKISHDPSLSICSQSLLKTSSHPFNNEVETGEGRHSLFTCSLLLGRNAFAKPAYLILHYWPRLLLSVVTTCRFLGQIYWGQVSLQGGERSPLRWGELSEAVAAWAPLLLLGPCI